MSKGVAINEVKEKLGSNDTSVNAKLYLNSAAYIINSFDIKFQEAFDFKSEPQREVKGGLL